MNRHLSAAATALLLASRRRPRADDLNVGMAAADVSQLDPHRATTTQDKPLISWIYNGLVRFSPARRASRRSSPISPRTGRARPTS